MVALVEKNKCSIVADSENSRGIRDWAVLVRYPHNYTQGLLVPYAQVPALVVA